MASVQLVQLLSRVWLFATPWNAARQASLSITNSQSSLRLNVHRVSDAIQPSHPLSSPSPPAPNPSQHQSLFQWVNYSHEVANSIGQKILLIIFFLTYFLNKELCKRAHVQFLAYSLRNVQSIYILMFT